MSLPPPTRRFCTIGSFVAKGLSINYFCHLSRLFLSVRHYSFNALFATIRYSGFPDNLLKVREKHLHYKKGKVVEKLSVRVNG